MIHMIETIYGLKYTIKQILKENWETFHTKHKGFIRLVAVENVNKVMSCGDKNILGYNTYVCPECGDKKFVAHTCKSRFCNSCGKVKNDEWIEKAQGRLFNIPHKHIVLTIPWEIRILFMENRRLLSLLHQAAGQAILDWAETVHFLPGVVSVLHTFGSKLNFNCHIHVLYSLGGINYETGKFMEYDFIPAESIKARFKTIILGKLRKEFMSKTLEIGITTKAMWLKKFNTTVFFEVQNRLWQKEWYLYVGEKLDNASESIAYVGRYAKRPCLSEAKIVTYEKDSDLVRFSYKDKITKEETEIDFSIEDFIIALIRQIPEKHFNMIRYYGIYSNVKKKKVLTILAKRLIYLYDRVYLLFEPRIQTWRERIEELTGNNPLFCKKCQRDMILTEITHRSRDGTWWTTFV